MDYNLYRKLKGLSPQKEARPSPIDTDDPNELLARTKRYFEAYLKRQRGGAGGKKEHLIGTAVTVFGVDANEARQVFQEVLAAKGIAEDKLVKIDQPALKDEKPEEDDVAADANLEPVDFKKDQEDTLTPVTDKDLEEPTQLLDAQGREYLDTMFDKKEDKVPPQFVYDKIRKMRDAGTSDEEIAKQLQMTLQTVQAVESCIHEGLHELAVELDNITSEEKALITAAIEKGLIRNEIPSYDDMINCIIDLGAAEKLGAEEAPEILRKGILGTADKMRVTADWVKGVILPFIQGELGDHDVGDMYHPPAPTMHGDELKPDDERPRESVISPVLHICNDCAKTFTATEAKCTNCQSENVEAIVEEHDDDTEAGRLGYTPEQWALLDHIETSMDSFVTDLDDTYTWDVTQPTSAQDVYEWLEDKQPWVFENILRDPDVLSTDAGSEAFFEAMADLGIAVKKPEVDHSREDRAEEDRRPFEETQARELSEPDKMKLKRAADTMKGETTGLSKDDARATIKDLIGMDEPVDESITLNELRDLIPELDLPADDKILLNQAFEEGFLEDKTPTYTYMLQQLIDAGYAEKVGMEDAGQDLKTGTLAGVAEVAAAYLRDIILPKLRHRYGVEDVDEANKDGDKDDDEEITIPDKPVEEVTDKDVEDMKTPEQVQRLKNHIAQRKCGKDYAECGAEEKAMIDKQFNEARVDEFEDDKNTYTSGGRGLEKDEAEEIARRKKGHAVVDDEDETKWMVVQRTDEETRPEKYLPPHLRGRPNPRAERARAARQWKKDHPEGWEDEKPASQEHKCNICLKDVSDVGDLNPEDLCRQCAKRQAREARQLCTKKEARSEFRRYLS